MSNWQTNSSSDEPELMIPLYKSDIDPGVIEKLVAMSMDGSIGSAGLVEEFEFQLLESLGRKKADGHFAVATADIGIAYRLAFSMLAIQPGDEIVMPALQRNRVLIEAAEAFEAKPVLVDIDEETIGIGANEADNAITDKTKCIVAIDHEMTTCNHDGLRKVAEKREVEIIHDISTSYGTTYKEEPIGRQHEMTVLSCTPSDSLNCVEGAALLGRGFERLRLAEKAREIVLALPRANDKVRPNQIRIDSESIGLAYRITALHAGIGTSQIARISRSGQRGDPTIKPQTEQTENSNVPLPSKEEKALLKFIDDQNKTSENKDPALGLAHQSGLKTQASWLCLGDAETTPNAAIQAESAAYLTSHPEVSEATKSSFRQPNDESFLPNDQSSPLSL